MEVVQISKEELYALIKHAMEEVIEEYLEDITLTESEYELLKEIDEKIKKKDLSDFIPIDNV